MDLGMVEAVQTWLLPTMVDLQRFLGISNFSRSIIHNYMIDAPLISFLTSKPKSLSCNADTSYTFQSLKDALTSANSCPSQS